MTGGYPHFRKPPYIQKRVIISWNWFLSKIVDAVPLGSPISLIRALSKEYLTLRAPELAKFVYKWVN